MDAIYSFFNTGWVSVAIILLYGIILMSIKEKHENLILKICAVVLLVLGTIVHWKPYSFALSSYTFFWSIISSAVLFLTKSSIEAIHISDEIAHATNEVQSGISSGYLNAYFTIYVCAIMTSAYFIWRTFFGRHLKNAKMLFQRFSGVIFHPVKQHENIFFEWNGPTHLLKNDLCSKGDKVTIIVSPQEKRKRMKVFDFLKKEELVYSPDEIKGAELLISRIPLFLLKFKNLKNCCSAMGYRQLYIRMKEADLFFLSDDENSNIRMALSFAKLGVSGKIYCHCRKESIKKYYSDAYGAYDIVFVDSAELAIRSLKMGDEGRFPYHPINFVDVAEDDEGRRLGYVKSPFNAMLLGFGQTGQEAMSFLYEFGAFPQKNQERSEFHCLAYDIRMNDIEGRYIADHPSVDFNSVSLKCSDINSSEFWGELSKERTGLLKKPFISLVNYVVVSLGEDQRNVAVGIDLLKKVYEYRKGDLKNFIILIHTIAPTPEIRETVQYYKRIYGEHIQIFGSNESVWKMSIIDNSKLKVKAAKYYDSYLNAQGDEIKEYDCSASQEGVLALADLIFKEFQPKNAGAEIRDLIFSILANVPSQDVIEQNEDYLSAVRELSSSLSSVSQAQISEDSLYDFLICLMRQKRKDDDDVKEKGNQARRVAMVEEIAKRITVSKSVIPFLYLLAFYQLKYVKGVVLCLVGERKAVSGYNLRLLRKEMLKAFFGNGNRIELDGLEFYKDAIKEIYKIERQDSQDVSNALHLYTQMMLSDASSLRTEAEKIECSYWTWKAKQQGKDIEGKEMRHYYGADEYAIRAFEYLAICEHLRWEASHEMMGYKLSDDGDTNDLLRVHNSMIPFDKLNALDKDDVGSYKHYDWVVVKTSFQILDRMQKELVSIREKKNLI